MDGKVTCVPKLNRRYELFSQRSEDITLSRLEGICNFIVAAGRCFLEYALYQRMWPQIKEEAYLVGYSKIWLLESEYGLEQNQLKLLSEQIIEYAKQIDEKYGVKTEDDFASIFSDREHLLSWIGGSGSTFRSLKRL